MSRVRRSGTAPETALRSALHRKGFRFRLNSGKELPGTPDLVLPRFRIAIFVDGCFWHGCEEHGSTPKTNTRFWTAKILRNQERDQQVDGSLRSLGWHVMRLWEHEVARELDAVVARIRAATITRAGSRTGRY
jgi:DNA mismatch endonuclease (patch repair protein)